MDRIGYERVVIQGSCCLVTIYLDESYREARTAVVAVIPEERTFCR